MSDKILKGMVEAMDRAGYQTRQGLRTEYMAHALRWLAENVSDQMAFAAIEETRKHKSYTVLQSDKIAIRGAILKASESGE